MKVKVLKNAIKVTHISNESQLEMVDAVADAAGSEYEQADFGTTVIVTTNLDAFVQEWNGQ